MRSSAVMERSASEAVDEAGDERESGDDEEGEAAAVAEVLAVESDALICDDEFEQGKKEERMNGL